MLSDLRYRLRAVLRRRRMESELDEELQFHFDHQVEDYVGQGLPPDEARRRARLLFGGLEQVKDECRDARGVSLVEVLWQDVRYAGRQLARSPGFGVLAALSLAIGVGSSTLSLSMLGQAAFEPIAAEAPERLVALQSPGRNSSFFAYPMYLDLRARSRVFSGVVARSSAPADFVYSDRSDRVTVELVSTNYFEVLGVTPACGRVFTQEDEGLRTPQPVVLSYEYWQRRFARDPSIVGRNVLLNSLPAIVAGVSAPEWRGLGRGQSPEVHLPMVATEALLPASRRLGHRGAVWVNIVARLKPGVAGQRARAELRPLDLVSAKRGIQAGYDPRRMLAGLSVIAAGILITVCANLAGLCLARAAVRQKEIAIRVALGAGRARVAGQLLAEFLLPAAAGGVLGLVMAVLTAGAIPNLLFDEQTARSLSTAPELGKVAAALAISGLMVVLFGAAPALLPALGRVQNLFGASNTAVLGSVQPRFRKALVAAQVALATGLVFGALSISRELIQESSRRLGSGKDNLIAFSVDASTRGYKQAQAQRLYERLEESLAAMPGVRAAGFLALGKWEFEVEGLRFHRPDDRCCLYLHVSPGYFATAGCALVEGRGFGRGGEYPPRAVLVNEAFKRRIFGGRSPVGKHVRPAGFVEWAEVAGVLRDDKSPNVYSSQPSVYWPYAGVPSVNYLVRTALPAERLLPDVKQLVRKEAPDVPVYELNTIEARFAEAFHDERVLSAVLCASALLTMALAAVGVYGMMSYVVSRRTREIGVRMVLGATAAMMRSMVMKEVVWITIAGVATEVCLALLLSWLLAGSGDGLVRVEEAPMGAAAMIVVASAALLAGLAPSLRATRIDCAVALRDE